ncbi:hypothetical protein [Nitrosomonas aestuarii]|uniref:hypothetical protein n=1 Tax=Nitrosomonas aestuarii TaxID=52441 RepID=UPI000D3125BE|nr:hypothetical protein [Nitrosomonas aestuarii]PTN11479.1 hypothetical protein C8R11_10922 [Nitrosomonas aestuarii]
MKYTQTLIVFCMLSLLIAGNTAVIANDYISSDVQRIGMATSHNKMSTSRSELKRLNATSEAQASCASQDMDELDSSHQLGSGSKKHNQQQAC